MSSTAEQIWAAFGQDCDLYEVIGVDSKATDKEITRAYRKLALRYHPDKHRGDEASKAESTAKFQALSAVHSLLCDAESRAYYDETGTIISSDSEQSPSFQMWVDYFARIFPKVTESDIAKFETEYRFSDEETRDVLAAYEKFEGQMQPILDSIMLCTDEDEERFVEMIESAIKAKTAKSVPKWRAYLKARATKPHKTLTAMQAKKKQARKDKEAREAEELLQKIRNNQRERASGSGSMALTGKRERGMESLLATLEAKYADKPKGKKKRSAAPQSPVGDEPSEEEFLAAQRRLKTSKRK